LRSYLIVNASNEGICDEFERKNPSQHWFSYSQIARINIKKRL